MGRERTTRTAETANRRQYRERRGFTLVELIIALAILSVMLSVLVPPFLQLTRRENLLGLSREAKQLVTRARFEAIKRGTPTVVMLDVDTNELFAFADVHGNAVNDPSDGVYNPVIGGALRRTDYEIGRLPLRGGIEWRDPDGATDLDSVDGFDNSGSPEPPDQQIVFSSSGEANSAGAIRFADPRGNFIELRIAQPATGKLSLQKWNDTTWLEQGAQGESWTWQ